MITDAKWIKSPINEIEGCYDFYRSIDYNGEIKKATLYATAMGVYCAFIDGKRVSDELLTPYFTAYQERTQYQEYDVTDMLKPNCELSLLCSEGWAVGYLHCGEKRREHYNDNIALLYSLDIEFSDGTKMTVVSDTNTKVRTPYLLHALSENGYMDLAYDLLLQEEYPSWLYSVNKGATTIWEHWDGIKEDGSFWYPSMNSFNHYAYGSVYDWIFGKCAGINIADGGAGYSCVTIKPNTDKRLGFLNAGINTKHGHLSSKWSYEDNKTVFEFEIPKGVTADIILPDGQTETVCGQAVKKCICAE